MQGIKEMRGSRNVIKPVLLGLGLLDGFLFGLAVYFAVETDTMLQMAALIVKSAV